MNKIAFLNDGLRRTFARGKVLMTAGVAALPEDAAAQILERVRHFDEFTADNDPRGQHDFGSFELAGVTYFFKIDYYSPDMEGGLRRSCRSIKNRPRPHDHEGRRILTPATGVFLLDALQSAALPCFVVDARSDRDGTIGLGHRLRKRSWPNRAGSERGVR